MRIGRWAASASAIRYIQSGMALLAHARTPDITFLLGRAAAATFSTFALTQ